MQSAFKKNKHYLKSIKKFKQNQNVNSNLMNKKEYVFLSSKQAR